MTNTAAPTVVKLTTQVTVLRRFKLDPGLRPIIIKVEFNPGSEVPVLSLLEGCGDSAIDQATHKPDFCVILQREQEVAKLIEGRDVAWHSFQYGVEPADCVPVEGNHPAYILYTSGTTGAPKGVMHTFANFMAETNLFPCP